MDDEFKLPSDEEITGGEETLDGEDDFKLPSDDELSADDDAEDPFAMGFHEEESESETDF